jgi:hypothetical protein
MTAITGWVLDDRLNALTQALPDGERELVGGLTLVYADALSKAPRTTVVWHLWKCLLAVAHPSRP